MKNIQEKSKDQKARAEDEEVLVEPELMVICKHCGKQIEKVKLVGFSLICPLCGKPQNGQTHPNN